MRNHLPAHTLAGNLIVAHPGLQDPNFRRSVVLISAHSSEEGAFGVVVNRPTEHTLGTVKPEYIGSPLSRVPLYHGGPVGSDEVILTAWRCVGDGELRLYFGMSSEKALQIMEEDPNADIRAFLGYSGWGEGQLESELKENAWVLSPLVGPLLDRQQELHLWRSILHHIKPELGFQADQPDDPSLN